MAGDVETSVARTDVDLKALRERLVERAMVAPARVLAGGPAAVGERSNPLEVVEEILAEAKKEVDVPPFAESRPLLKVLEKIKAAGGESGADAAHLEAPPEFLVDHEVHRYDFHLVTFGFTVNLDDDQFARRAEFGVLIEDDMPDGTPRQTRPVRMFPGRQDVTWFKADLQGGVGLDTKFEFALPGHELIPYPELQADANLKAGLAFGPFSYAFRRAALTVTGLGDEKLYWDYALKSQLNGKNQFQSMLVLKVPLECRKVILRTALKVVPCRRSWLFFDKELPAKAAQQDIEVELGRTGVQ